MKRLSQLPWILALATACAPTTGPRLVTGQDVLDALRDAGAVVADTALLAPRHLGGVGRVWQVNQAVVQIDEFETEAARQAVSDGISPDGLTLDGQPLIWSEQPHVWALGRVIVAYDGTDGATIMLLSGLLGDPLNTPAGEDAPYPPAVTAAIAALAEELGIDPATVEVVSFEEVEWPDACLGAAGAGEVCEGVLTPGWRIRLRAADEPFEFHTDWIGAYIRRP